ASLQRLTHEVRVTMRAARPELPHGARVLRFQWPRMSSLAFVDPKAFHVWCRDWSLRVVSMDELAAHPDAGVDVAIGFEPRRTPQGVMIAPRRLTHPFIAARSFCTARPPNPVDRRRPVPHRSGRGGRGAAPRLRAAATRHERGHVPRHRREPA